MRTSFSFDGVSCEHFGLYYAPELRDTYVWRPSASTIHEQRFDGHPGGYFYGATKNYKDFTLRCYYEDEWVVQGLLTKIESFYKIGKTAKLVFSNRDWIWYNATIVNFDDSGMRNTSHGVITIAMRAYYPFGRSDVLSPTASALTQDQLNNSGLLSNLQSMFPTSKTFTSISRSSPGSMLLYNPGTATADTLMTIKCSGSFGGGLTITNKTTGQRCYINSAVGSTEYRVDSLTGYCYRVIGTTREFAPLYHDLGFIQVSSGIDEFIADDVLYRDGMIMKPYDKVYSKDVGRYIRVFDKVFTVSAAGSTDEYSTLTLSPKPSYSNDLVCKNACFIKPNEISIMPDATVTNLTISFDYKPTFM